MSHINFFVHRVDVTYVVKLESGVVYLSKILHEVPSLGIRPKPKLVIFQESSYQACLEACVY